MIVICTGSKSSWRSKSVQPPHASSASPGWMIRRHLLRNPPAVDRQRRAGDRPRRFPAQKCGKRRELLRGGEIEHRLLFTQQAAARFLHRGALGNGACYDLPLHQRGQDPAGADRARLSAASAVATPSPIPRVDPVTIEVLPLSVILLLISPAGRCPIWRCRITPQPGRGDAANWFRAGPMTDATLRNAWAVRRGEPRRIGIGVGIAPIWRNYRYVGTQR